MMDLAIRQTRKYVGTYQHLDQWESIGSCEVIGTKEIPLPEDEEYDVCDPQAHDHWVLVESEASPEKIKEALTHSFTQHDCHHEYDCCGCRSYRASKVEHEGGRVWRVKVSSSRNF